MKKFLFFGLGAVLVLCVSIFATSSYADADAGGKRIISENSSSTFEDTIKNADTIDVEMKTSDKPVILEITNGLESGVVITIMYINGCKYYRFTGFRREAVTHAGDCEKCHQRRIDEVKQAMEECENVTFCF